MEKVSGSRTEDNGSISSFKRKNEVFKVHFGKGGHEVENKKCRVIISSRVLRHILTVVVGLLHQ